MSIRGSADNRRERAGGMRGGRVSQPSERWILKWFQEEKKRERKNQKRSERRLAKNRMCKQRAQSSDKKFAPSYTKEEQQIKTKVSGKTVPFSFCLIRKVQTQRYGSKQDVNCLIFANPTDFHRC